MKRRLHHRRARSHSSLLLLSSMNFKSSSRAASQSYRSTSTWRPRLFIAGPRKSQERDLGGCSHAQRRSPISGAAVYVNPAGAAPVDPCQIRLLQLHEQLPRMNCPPCVCPESCKSMPRPSAPIAVFGWCASRIRRSAAGAPETAPAGSETCPAAISPAPSSVTPNQQNPAISPFDEYVLIDQRAKSETLDHRQPVIDTAVVLVIPGHEVRSMCRPQTGQRLNVRSQPGNRTVC